MFSELYPAVSTRRSTLLSVSVATHLVLLALLLHASAPTILAPSFVVKGVSGGSVTSLYWPSRPSELNPTTSGAESNKASHQPAGRTHITWTRSRNIGKTRESERQLSKEAQEDRAVADSTGQPAIPAGSPYGSVSQGAISGFEVRPALWASGSDPIVLPGDLAGGLEGDVIVEIMIDEQGNVVRTIVLQSLTPEIDTKVMASLQNWHFRPATRDGRPIASKQDVHYHYPARRL